MLHKKAADVRFRNSDFSFSRADNVEIIPKKKRNVNKKVRVIRSGLSDMPFHEKGSRLTLPKKHWGCR